MSQRLELLGFLQESAVRLRKLAREQPTRISAELIRLADDVAQQAAGLEAELLKEGLLDAGLTAPKAVDRT